ncbi:hypothetical protein A4A49_59275, partial [Nicotiana attenuata]
GSTTQPSQATTQSKGDYFFTEAQYQQILGFLNNKDSPSEVPTRANNAGKINAISSNVEVLNEMKDRWIVDSGATHHISSILDLMSDVSRITDKGREKVTRPNEGCAKIEHIGSSFLSAIDKLKNVLHVPDFKFNLMSMSKLTRDLSCAAIFLPKLCVFQDLYNGRVKGIGKEDEGLYVLKRKGIRQLAAHIGMKVSTGDTWDLWHKRLGHASIPVMQHVSFLQNKVDNNLEASFLQLDLSASEEIVPIVSHSEDFSQSLVSHKESRGSTHAEPATGHHDVNVEPAPNMEEIDEPDADEPVVNNHDAEVHNDHVQQKDIPVADVVAPDIAPS